MDKPIPLEMYKKIHKLMPIPVVDVVIKYDGKILLGMRNNEPAKGLFWFPGGRILKDETLEHAAVRKVLEETGIDVKVVKMLGAEETIFNKGPFGWGTHSVNFIYLVDPKGKIDIAIDDQHSEYQWFSKTKKDFHPYVKKYIKLAHE